MLKQLLNSSFAVITGCVFLSCGGKHKDVYTESPVITQYRMFLATLDTQNVNSVTHAAEKYQHLLKKKTAATCDTAYTLFEAYYHIVQLGVDEVFKQDTVDYSPLYRQPDSVAPAAVSEKLKRFEATLARNGFKIWEEEGAPYIDQNMDFIARWFYGSVTPAMKKYLKQLHKESKEGLEADAGLVISPETLFDRVVWWEQFVQGNQQFVYIEEARHRKLRLLTIVMRGMDNSPVRAGDSLDVYYKDGYDWLTAQYPNSEVHQLVSVYYNALLQGDFKKADGFIKEYEKKGVILKWD